MQLKKRSSLIWAITASVASALTAATFGAQSTNTAGTVRNGQSDGGTGNPSLNNPAITISFGGQTALKAFSGGPAITELDPGSSGSSIILHDGTSGAAVTYYAPSSSGTSVQLASKTFNVADTGITGNSTSNAPATQRQSAIRIEWHSEGSVQGLIDLVNDQVGYAGGYTGTPLADPALRAVSSANATYVNSNKFTSAGTTNGLTLSSNGSVNTYDTPLNDPGNATFSFSGTNLQGGQNRFQFAIGEYPTEEFADANTAATPSLFANPSTAGYGQGNPSLATPVSGIAGTGTVNSRQKFVPTTAANLATNIQDPSSSTGATYSAGPWNTAGTSNIDSTAFAVSAVAFTANPGTGLLRVNNTDAQWLQTTGRLQNGAQFNYVDREVNTGQRVVAALNSGIDPSWAVGVNDGGNSTGANAIPQHSIGPSIRFSGKTSGSEAVATLLNSRLAVSAVALSDIATSGTSGAQSNAPARVLDETWSAADPTTGNVTNDSGFTHLNFTSIQTGTWQADLISHINTIKAPNPSLSGLTATQWANTKSFNSANLSDPTVSGIKGDQYGDVAAVLANVVNSVGTAGTGITPTNAANPADGLFSSGFLIPQLLTFTRQTDGAAEIPQTLTTAQQNLASAVQANFGNLFTTDNTYAANTETIGVGSYYGAAPGSTAIASANQIPITAKYYNGSSWVAAADGNVTAPGGNYLLGNFNQNGSRDYSSALQSANAAISLHHVDATYSGGGANNFLAGAPIGAVVPSALTTNPGWVQSGTNTKGDLIVLGDANSDGSFDGADVYYLATGAALADKSFATSGPGGTLNVTSSSGLTTADGASFADAVRSNNAYLFKNSALNAIQQETVPLATDDGYNADRAWLRQTGRAVLVGATTPSGATYVSTNSNGTVNYTWDPNGNNSFNKFDVGRNGYTTTQNKLADAQLVDAAIGKSYASITDVTGAGLFTASDGYTYKQNLVNAKLIDDGSTSITRADFNLIAGNINSGSSTLLYKGDTNFDGSVGLADLSTLLQNYGSTTQRWGLGNFDQTTTVGLQDLTDLLQNYGHNSITGTVVFGDQALLADPAALSLLSADGFHVSPAVPEPTTLSLVTIGAVGFLARRRRRSS